MLWASSWCGSACCYDWLKATEESILLCDIVNIFPDHMTPSITIKRRLHSFTISKGFTFFIIFRVVWSLNNNCQRIQNYCTITFAFAFQGAHIAPFAITSHTQFLFNNDNSSKAEREISSWIIGSFFCTWTFICHHAVNHYKLLP